MADPANVFTQIPPSEPKDLLSELVGEGKKYKTSEDLARSRLEADKHIAKIELENRELRDKVASAKGVEDVLAAVQAKTASVENPTEIQEFHQRPQAGISADEVAQIVEAKLTGLETAKQKSANLKRANDLMVQMFGEKAKDVFGKEPEATREALTKLAEVDPDRFASFFKKEAPGSVVDAGGRNTAAINTNTSGSVEPGTRAYYASMRKKDPSAYYSPRIQLEMHEMALRDPAKYFGKDYSFE